MYSAACITCRKEELLWSLFPSLSNTVVFGQKSCVRVLCVYVCLHVNECVTMASNSEFRQLCHKAEQGVPLLNLYGLHEMGNHCCLGDASYTVSILIFLHSIYTGWYWFLFSPRSCTVKWTSYPLLLQHVSLCSLYICCFTIFTIRLIQQALLLWIYLSFKCKEKSQEHKTPFLLFYPSPPHSHPPFFLSLPSSTPVPWQVGHVAPCPGWRRD